MTVAAEPLSLTTFVVRVLCDKPRHIDEDYTTKIKTELQVQVTSTCLLEAAMVSSPHCSLVYSVLLCRATTHTHTHTNTHTQNRTVDLYL